ncbi:MAG: hypothetical protein J6S30_04600 [Kiritimatiellae bacterium]|nr:hypothetical protein [Kiritimatiellia bacterium]
MKNEDGFTNFVCRSCKTEIEASLDMIGEETECPACGARITVPDNRGNDIFRLKSTSDKARAREQAMKSKTIRIELPDI